MAVVFALGRLQETSAARRAHRAAACRVGRAALRPRAVPFRTAATSGGRAPRPARCGSGLGHRFGRRLRSAAGLLGRRLARVAWAAPRVAVLPFPSGRAFAPPAPTARRRSRGSCRACPWPGSIARSRLNGWEATRQTLQPGACCRPWPPPPRPSQRRCRRVRGPSDRGADILRDHQPPEGPASSSVRSGAVDEDRRTERMIGRHRRRGCARASAPRLARRPALAPLMRPEARGRRRKSGSRA